MRTERELLNAAAEALGTYTIHSYDALNRVFFPRCDRENPVPLPCPVTELPGALPSLGPRSAWLLTEQFAAVDKGRESAECVLRADSEPQGRWYRVVCRRLDAEGGDGLTLVLVDDLSERRELRIAKERETQYFHSRAPADIAELEADLTDNTVLWREGGLFSELAERSGESYTALLHQASREYVAEDDQQYFLECFRIKNVLERFIRGERHIRHVCRASDKLGGVWLCCAAHLAHDPYDGHINMLLTVEKAADDRLTVCGQEHTGTRDWLTGLFNYRAFCEKASELLRESPGRMHALFLVDLDSYWVLNEHFGHLASWEVLKKTANALRLVSNDGDIAARIDADVFMLLKLDIPGVEAMQNTSKLICGAMREKGASMKDRFDNYVQISTSIGVSVFPAHADSFDQLYSRAEEALFHAKKRNGDRYYVYTNDWNSVSEDYEGIYVRTFGFFDVFTNGEVVNFKSRKAKELLAVLVDRHGGLLSAGEAIACLWEDDGNDKTTAARYRKVCSRLMAELDENGLGHLLVSKNGKKAVNIGAFSCDYYNFLSGVPPYRSLFRGAYMSNYSWAESTLAGLVKKSKYYECEDA